MQRAGRPVPARSSGRQYDDMARGWTPGFLLLTIISVLLAMPRAATARDSCPFLRDPAYWARTPVAPAADGELAIGSLNLYRLFDDQQDGNESVVLGSREFAARTARIVRYITQDMGVPAVIGLQEVEDDTALEALVAGLRRETGREYRWLLGEAAGDGEIRNGLLLDARLRVIGSESLFARTPRAGNPLHDRLPLVVDVDAGAQGKITFVVLHMKSQLGIDRPEQSARVIGKRRYQATELAAWAHAQAAAGRRLVVLGDLNSAPTAAGDPRGEPLRILLADGTLVDPAGDFLKPSQRWTYRYRCTLQQLDHVLVSRELVPQVGDYAIARGDTCIRVREKCDSAHSVSDHEGVVLHLLRR